MLRKPGKEIPALYGGVLMALLTNIPFLNLVAYGCCCGGVMLGGFLAVMFYKNDFTPEMPPFTVGDCVTVGGIAGLVGAAFGTILLGILLAAFGNIMGEFLLKMVQEKGIDSLYGINPELLQEAVHQGFSVIGFILELLKNLIIDILFGALGGLIAYNIFKPRYHVMPPSQMPPYSQPPPAI